MTFFLFEIRYWLRQPMLYIFILINALLVFGGVSSDNISIGGSMPGIYKNAAQVIVSYYGILSFIGMLMATAFMNGAAIRDFEYNTHQIVFSTPINKKSYLIGKFLGAALISSLPLLGVSLGVFVGQIFHLAGAERYGDTQWNAHIFGYFAYALPNSLFVGSIIFAIASLTRSTMASFIGTLILLVAYGVAGSFIRDLDTEYLALYSDSFGIRTYSILTKYWTASEKNVGVYGLKGAMLGNRILWLVIAFAVFAFTYFRFKFEERAKKKKDTEVSQKEEKYILSALPKVQMDFGSGSIGKMLWIQTKTDFLGVTKSVAFIILLLLGLLDMIPSLFSSNEMYGLTVHPVTYKVVENISGAMYLFLIAIVVFYSGSLVWKEREARMNDIYDALPIPNWISFTAKIIAMSGITAAVMFLGMLMGILSQAFKGYTNFELSTYFTLLGLDFLYFFFLILISMLIHTLVNQKYVGFFAVVVFMILNLFIWRPLDIATSMVKYGELGSKVYSDMNGIAPYVPTITAFSVYWLLFAGILSLITVIFWMRGRDEAFAFRWKNARQNMNGKIKLGFGVLGILWLLTAGFIGYNTLIVNKIQTSDELEKMRADYEKKYKKYEHRAQPRITDIQYNIQIFPESRDLIATAKQVLVNKSDKSIDSLHLTVQGEEMQTVLKIERGTLILDDKDLDYQIYKLSPALAPGDSITMDVEVKYISKGFENEVSFTKIVQNGSFFNHTDFMPQIGYQPKRELSENNDRKDYDLADKERMKPLQKNCTTDCMDTYISNNSDWVNLETVISTSSDQIAIAPGTLVKEWKEGDRRYFRYKLDHKALNFYSFLSAKYEVAREKWQGIDIEVYYHKGHYNVDKMLKSVRKSLEYYTQNFGAYYHKQCRIIEFPRYENFAQAFPGTMPYSESIGFISKIEKPEDIDQVFYIVAHEMAHQYWAHQVCGAEMEGGTLLSETFAQYSALMVMEKEYGADNMRKFLKYETDNYLRSRGTETQEEKPLMRVEAGQGYIHYRKGSAVMYYFKEMIGEEALNRSLQQFLEKYAYQEPPYPTSYDMLDIFRQNTPDSLQYLIHDLFEEITLHSNRTLEATAKKLPDGKYQITLKTESQKFKADGKGKETELPLGDWVEIGAYGEGSGDGGVGKLLYKQKVKITKKNNEFSFVLSEKPAKVGIDVRSLLIDRMPSDNLKTPVFE